jgi:hypothetical protein
MLLFLLGVALGPAWSSHFKDIAANDNCYGRNPEEFGKCCRRDMADEACQDWFWACVVANDDDCPEDRLALGCEGTWDMCLRICDGDSSFQFCPDDGKGKVPGWAIAIIVIMTIIAIIAFVTAICACAYKNQKQTSETTTPAAYQPQESQTFYIQPAGQVSMAPPPPAYHAYPYPGYGYD